MRIPSVTHSGIAAVFLQLLSLTAAQTGGTVFSGFPKPPIFPTGVDSNDKSTVTLTGSDISSEFTEIRIIGGVTGARTVLGVWTPNSQPSDSTALPVTLEVSVQRTAGKPPVAKLTIPFRPFDDFWNDLMTVEADLGPPSGIGVSSTSSFDFVITTKGFQDFPARIQQHQAQNNAPVLSTNAPAPTPPPSPPSPSPQQQPQPRTTLVQTLTSAGTTSASAISRELTQSFEQSSITVSSSSEAATPAPDPATGVDGETPSSSPSSSPSSAPSPRSSISTGTQVGIALGVILGNAVVIGSLALICARRGCLVSIPLLCPGAKSDKAQIIKTAQDVYQRNPVIHIDVKELDATTLAAELEAQRGPFELEGSTSFYRRSLAAVRSAGKIIIRSAATSRTGNRTSFDADTDTTYSRSVRTRLSAGSSGPPLPTPSDYAGRDRRFTFGPAPSMSTIRSRSSDRSSRGSQISSRSNS
ncbi:hypothetical protein jhhlp_008535 [Lomentospora prolificans]|uniref:IPT/TIG domain-containing protein n=1 Tax=Lomentospora prolificans TaxID=41688 RepID=A0A2N3MYB5_9PEZI|nr:hypothetical protein jhhlp_008535 [Lomentospora prolificans]